MIWYSAVSLLSIALLPPRQVLEVAEAQPAAEAAQVQPPAPETPPPSGYGFPLAPRIPACNSYRLQYDYPLNGRQRTCTWLSNLLTDSAIFGAGAGAAYAQLFKTDPAQWGRGPQGLAISYGSRYAAGMAKATGEYVAAWIAHQDPRPYRSKHKNYGARIWDAGSSLFADHHGKTVRFAPATLLGAAASGFSGMAWYPTGSNSVSDALVRGGQSLLGSLAYAEFYEFEPDIFRLLSKWFSPKLK